MVDDGSMAISTPTLIAVERLNDGIVVRFADGLCVLFSTTLLHALSPQAQALSELDQVWDDLR